MAYVSWPADLPQCFQLNGFTEALPNNLLKDDIDMPPVSLRSRGTSAPYRIAGNVTVTTEQWLSLRSFFHSDLADGALRFVLPPQASSDVLNWICRFSEPPKRSYLNDDLWSVSIRLERLGNSRDRSIGPALFDNSNLFYAPRVIVNAGALSPVKLTNVTIFRSPSVVGNAELEPVTVPNTSTFYAPTVGTAWVEVAFAQVASDEA